MPKTALGFILRFSHHLFRDITGIDFGTSLLGDAEATHATPRIADRYSPKFSSALSQLRTVATVC